MYNLEVKKGTIIFIIILVLIAGFWFANKQYIFYNYGMNITSPQFKDGGTIPCLYTCDGSGYNPPLIFDGVPKDAQSLVLIVDDPDIPDGVKQNYKIDVWDHWVVYNIPPETTKIEENSVPAGIVGNNTAGKNAYAGMCPPDREHRYFFKLYALNTKLNLPLVVTAKDVVEAMKGNIIAEAQLMGKYQRR